jgi:16S rRNA (adenine1518-N6/adenine1519-N6)-dimethyltransferase
MSHFDKQKAFGQHFLIDPVVITTIGKAALDALIRNPGHALLEIGPGKGAITRPLMENVPKEIPFYIAERDREFIDYWKPETRFAKILEGDVLRQDENEFAAIGPMVVVSNLPYSAGTAIVVMLCEMKHQIPEMVLMFQAEVAKRLYSGPSTPDRGSLSLYIQNEWDIEKLITVKPAAFNPPPRVMSEVVRLKRREKSHIPVETVADRKRFNDLLKRAFQQRRKMLKGNFNGTLWQQSLERSGVDPTLRAEALEWKDWIALWNA